MARGRFATRRPGMVKNWGSAVITKMVITATPANVGTLVSVSLEPLTVLRIRGEVFISGVPDAALEVAILGMGFIVVSEAAETAGGAAMPGPIDDTNAPWLWHKFVVLENNELTTADAASIGLNSRIEIDAKAMRVIRADERLVFMAETTSQTLVTVNLTAAMRILTGFHRG